VTERPGRPGSCSPHFHQNRDATTPPERSLYAIRNAINHGTVDVDDPETAMIIESRFPELWLLVFSMVSGILHLKLRPKVPHA
jgi:hypothetical protein